MLQQRFSEGGGPIVVGRKRPTRPDISPVFGHAAGSSVVMPAQHTPLPCQGPPARREVVEADSGVQPTISAGTLRMILLWAAAGRKSPQIRRSGKKTPHLHPGRLI